MYRINPFMLSVLAQLFGQVCLLQEGCLVSIYYRRFAEFSESNANSVDPDQTPRFAASDLGLHCLPVSLLWDARLKSNILDTCFLQLSLLSYICFYSKFFKALNAFIAKT